MTKYFFYLLLIPALSFAQANNDETSIVYKVLGKNGLLLFVFLLFFVYAYKNSVKLFAWIEDQTYGTRDYIIQKFELLFIEVKPNHVTYALLGLSFGIAIIIMLVFFVFGKFTAGIFLGFFAGFVGWKTPKPIMDFFVNRRISTYEDQMVDGLNLLSNGLRAGLSVPQSIGMVVEELPAPISQEFGMVLQQTKIGVTLDEAFENLAKRVPTQDNDMFVSSVSILRETGGNLAEVFDTIAEVIRERVRLKQKINTFVAQGKMQGGLIASMPFMMGAYFASTDPTFTDLLFGTIAGNILLVAALILNFIGAWAMWKVIQIKV
ncbi:MAG: type II secretion system F family protein [Flavobacteriaceae bacterium]|nr:type II secretion system F family protein [Flavobacteriaceae bacterium]